MEQILNKKIEYKAGIDIGSTTVKLVITDLSNNIVFGEYVRHMANTKKALTELLIKAKSIIETSYVSFYITGSGSLGISKAVNIPFIQEVTSVAKALKTLYPKTDVCIELGGEDAKIIYFKGGLEERMNGVCAGGTGSFIDQMAYLLKPDALGLNKAAAFATEIYPIASRCGVFAKTDIQPLINDGAKKSDIAASVFKAVVNQTISGLACGKPIRGNVAFLGGPLHFLPELKKSFIKTLKLKPENVIDPENSHLFAALGACFCNNLKNTNGNGNNDFGIFTADELITNLKNNTSVSFETKRLQPLFKNEEEYKSFIDRHSKQIVKRKELKNYSGNCFLGLDAGSTTTKMALISQNNEILYTFYSANNGNPVKTAQDALLNLGKILPKTATIAGCCTTGYGEQLLKAAFNADCGEVETIAHSKAAQFFNKNTDCVLDIGGQDMKCIRLKNGIVDNIMLNEACSSGCGSFIENFAVSLGLTAEEFSNLALKAKAPVDLGTRCTVFMNSNVKQAQKEGATVEDISAGLAYSVVKNALYKVIKLPNAKELGKTIVVQGGTFYNKAVLRALEKITGVEVICPDICGLMGAFGAALIAKEHFYNITSSIKSDIKDNIKSENSNETLTPKSSLLSFEEIKNLTYKSTAKRCSGCENRCLLTVNTFSGLKNKTYITGNRCEKMVKNENAKKGENLFIYKRDRIFNYPSLPQSEAVRGTVGIPRVLNIYENFPFWATFFKALKFRVVLSPYSSKEIYNLGMESIPSESECYPAKLAHGHIQWLINQNIKTIFHPSIFYERKENTAAKNNFNCPMVIAYPENIKNNVEDVFNRKVKYLHPFISFKCEATILKSLYKMCKNEWNIPYSEVKKAVSLAFNEQLKAKKDIKTKGEELLKSLKINNEKGIVLAGRPYHIDPEIKHGIPEMIASYGLNVFTEDSLKPKNLNRNLRVLDQWTYHSRLYNAAETVAEHNNLELVQLNSFGCGLDAVTSDQVSDILANSNKFYTLLKIDEVNNLGAARIRIRSLLAAMESKKENSCDYKPYNYVRTEFTKDMFDNRYTILAPQMSPVHFDLIEPVFNRFGFNVEILNNATKNAVDVGLKYVNNDACYPSVIMVGQMMEAVLSGKYDTKKLALLMTQTGGCCRASNYVGFIRRALDKTGLSYIPVISLNAGGLETNSGFKLKPAMLKDGFKALIWGDILMRCILRVRPYEKVKGSANNLHKKWNDYLIKILKGEIKGKSFSKICKEIVEDFDNMPINETVKKPKVGIVGEILVKYMPLANNLLVDLLEKEGAEAVVPDFLDFMSMMLYNMNFKYEELGFPWFNAAVSNVGINFLKALRKPAFNALKNSKRFSAPVDINTIASYAKPFLSIGNQYGEGWFLCGEMAELLEEDVNNIVCIQPFGCLPNHVVGKGVIKALKAKYPNANIAAVDYDPGASEVNQLNRIKLLLSVAEENLNDK